MVHKEESLLQKHVNQTRSGLNGVIVVISLVISSVSN